MPADILRFVPKGISMRNILHQACHGCGHTWSAPAHGNCPKCHDVRVEVTGYDYCNLPRT